MCNIINIDNKYKIIYKDNKQTTIFYDQNSRKNI